MDTATTLYIVLGLLVVFYIVCTIFGAKTWQIAHVLLTFAVFAGSIVFVMFAAATLKTHQQWRSLYHEKSSKLDEVTQQNAVLENGVCLTQSGELKVGDSVRGLRLELGRELLDRGRVWRNCIPASIDDDAITLNLSQWGDETCVHVPGDDEDAALEPIPIEEPVVEADGAAAEGEPAEGEAADGQPAEAGGDPRPGGKAHGIVAKTVLYGFTESPLAVLNDEQRGALVAGSTLNIAGRETFCKVPWKYLGQFQVTSVTPTSVTLSPMLPLTTGQVATARAGKSSWVLYELCPVDSHQIFADLDETQLKTLFAARTMAVQGEDYERLVGEYVRDGKTGDKRTDPPDRLWAKVKFKQNHTIDVDAVGKPPPFSLRSFDSLGRALPARLRHGGEGDDVGKVEFAIGDTALLDSESAKELIALKICGKVEGMVYVRELRDYDYLFQRMYSRRVELSDAAEVIQRDTATIQGSLAKATDVVDRHSTVEQKRLTEDLERFRYERDAVAKYREAVEKQYDDVRTSLSNLYRTNSYLAAQLAELQRGMTDEINRRTEQAATRGAAATSIAP